MGIFLRWGVFGILVIAALMYAYHANRRLARQRPPAAEIPEICVAEIEVARLALEAAGEGEKLHQVFQSPLIADEEDEELRERLESVAADWYTYDGEEMEAAELRREVLAECRLNLES
jgi:hypothetical protein